MIGTYTLNVSAKLTLFNDYLKGLSFLHQKGIMHRDINPNNLTVTSLDDPKGVIIDLDSATMEEWSFDHMRGTVAYLAPEIVALKVSQDLKPYERSVDSWALGLSMYAMVNDQRFSWNHFRPGYRPSSQTVTPQLHAEFHRRISKLRPVMQDGPLDLCLSLIEGMTKYDADSRDSLSTASRALLKKSDQILNPRITLRSSQKRAREE